MTMSTALLTFDDKGFSMRIGIFLCTELGLAIIAPSGQHFSRAVTMLEKYGVFNFLKVQDKFYLNLSDYVSIRECQHHSFLLL